MRHLEKERVKCDFRQLGPHVYSNDIGFVNRSAIADHVFSVLEFLE